MEPHGLLDLAPAAWVALVASGLFLALARWYDRVPALVVALFALTLVLAHGEVLTGGAMLLPLDNLRGHAPFLDLPPSHPRGNHLQGDVLYLIYPERLACRRALAAGEWPLVAPAMGAGFPLLADPQSQALQPIATVGEGWLAPTAGPGAVAALRTLLALVFTFLLLRRLGAGRGPALAGSLAFGLGGFLQLWLGWPVANVAALLPAALYALVLTDQRGAPRDWTLLVLCLAALLLAGHPESVVYALAVIGAFVAARALDRASDRAPSRRRRWGRWGRWEPWRRGGRWAGGAAAALVLAGALAAPALLCFGELLPHSLRWARLTESRWTTAPDRPTGARPSAVPGGRLVQTVAPSALGDSRTPYYWGVRNSNEDAAGFVGTVTLLGALLAFPGWMAGARPVRHEILGLVLAEAAALALILPPRLFGLVPAQGVTGRLALVVDLGLVIAATATFERFRRGEVPRRLRLLGPPALALGLVAFHVWAYRAFPDPTEPTALDALRWGWVERHAVAAVLGAAVLSFGAGKRWLGPALAVVIAAELLLAYRPANPPMPRELAFPASPLLTKLEDSMASSPAGTRLVATGTALAPNLASVYGLADARVFSPMVPAAYVHLLEPAIGSWRGESPLLDGRDHPSLYDRLAVRWILSGPGAACPEGTDRVAADSTGVICRRRAAGGALRVGTEEPTFLSVSARGTHWSARFADGTSGSLAAALANVPGWRLLADRPAGRAAPVDTPAGDRPLVTAPVPAGSRRIDLVYRPTGFVLGLPLTALGIALLTAWTMRPPHSRNEPGRALSGGSRAPFAVLRFFNPLFGTKSSPVHTLRKELS